MILDNIIMDFYMEKPLVLIVDDNKITLKLLRKHLEASGFKVQEAIDGIDCLEKVEAELPDAIVLDVMMPRMDGYETVKRLKDHSDTRNIPVIIVTALNDIANQIKSIESGADDFLSKPIEEKLLISKVKLLSNYAIQLRKSEILSDILHNIIDGKIDITNKSYDEIVNETWLN